MTSVSTKLLVAGAAVMTSSSPLVAQELPATTVQALARVSGAIRDSGAVWGPRIWPGFRPDTIPLVFVIPGRGTALFGWTGTEPDGFGPIAGVAGFYKPEADRGAASTGTTLGGRRAAQMVVASTDSAPLLGLALHEAFHVFERVVAREGRRFGGSEASWLVSRYPIFDAANEAGVALEGRILHAALAARTPALARSAARQYAAARERRYRALDPQYAEFETLAELNEGLAEYALVRGHELAGERAMTHPSIRLLDSLTSAPSLSVRLRLYSTGSGLAFLLDRIAGPDWKQRLMDEDLSLFEMVARVSGFRDVENAELTAASRHFDLDAIRADAARRVEALKESRRRQADSILARPGMLVEIDGSGLPGRFIGQCGFDPQNMLQAGDGVVLHTRWLRICSGSSYDGEFNTTVVQGAGNTVLRAVIGEGGAVRITVGGVPLPAGDFAAATLEDVRLESPGLTLRLARADISRRGRNLTIKLHR